MKRFVLVLALWFVACGTDLAPKAPPNLPPGVTAQFYATYAIKDLDVIRDFAVDANKTTPPLIANATLLKVVDWHESLIKIIHASPAGWKAALFAGLSELQGKLTAEEYARLKPYIDSARVLVQEVPS